MEGAIRTSAVSAYIPCFNNALTIQATIESIRNQTVLVDELFVVDDASTDRSVEIVKDLGVRVIQNAENLGRGFVRALAITEASHPVVLSCDATNSLAPDFLENAMRWLDSENVAAAYGRMRQTDNSTAAMRWRGRHLFKSETELAVNMDDSLTTSAVALNRSMILGVGNFDPKLRHSEDIDLGDRLRAAGYYVVFDPALEIRSLNVNTIPEVLERYWRWYAGKDETVSWIGYLKQMTYSVKVMARQDLRAGDPLSVPISLISPHYQFWRSVMRKIVNPATGTRSKRMTKETRRS